jgi:transposase
MEKIITIGLDIAKSIFQIHAVCESGKVITKRLKRSEVEVWFKATPSCLVGLEACGSAHHWGRVLSAMGHDVRLLNPLDVKPYVTRNKTDARDAAAICEAVRSPRIRFVPIKSREDQAGQALHRSREMLIRQRVQVANAVRSQFAEMGVIADIGHKGFETLRLQVENEVFPAMLRLSLRLLSQQYDALQTGIDTLTKEIEMAARAHPIARELMNIAGVGVMIAHAMVTHVIKPERFATSRDFVAWLGLTPKEYQSGSRSYSGGISKQGNGYLRRLLVLSGVSRYKIVKRKPESNPHLTALIARRPAKVAIVAEAAHTARVIGAILRTGEVYRKPIKEAPIAA